MLAAREAAIKEGRLEDAKSYNEQKAQLEMQIARQKKRLHAKYQGKNAVVSVEDTEQIVSMWTKIPVQRLGDAEGKKLLKLDVLLHQRVVGQEEAVQAVAKAVRRSRAGLKSPNRPIGSFLCLAANAL